MSPMAILLAPDGIGTSFAGQPLAGAAVGAELGVGAAEGVVASDGDAVDATALDTAVVDGVSVGRGPGAVHPVSDNPRTRTTMDGTDDRARTMRR